MKTVLINGSPKQKDSASEVILSMLKNYLSGEVIEYAWNKKTVTDAEIETLLESDAVVFAFPLYIDSIPSHLLYCLMQVEEYAKKFGNKKMPMIYVVVNNGFFEGKQNRLAMECMEHWSKRCGFRFGQALGIGGGGMLNAIKGVPDGYGPKKRMSAYLMEMGRNITEQKSGENHTLELNYPAFLYKFQAEMGWRMSAKQNGLKGKDLNRRW